MLKTLVKFYFSKLFFLHSFVSLFFPLSRKKNFSHFSSHFEERFTYRKLYIYFFIQIRFPQSFFSLVKLLAIESFAPNARNSLPSLFIESIDQIVRGQSKDKSIDVQSNGEIESISLFAYSIDRHPIPSHCTNVENVAYRRCNFRNSFTLLKTRRRSMTIATIFLFLAETFSSFPFSSFFYEPISTQSFELYRHGHTPWNYQSYATAC